MVCRATCRSATSTASSAGACRRTSPSTIAGLVLHEARAHPRGGPDLCILRLSLRDSEARGHAASPSCAIVPPAAIRGGQLTSTRHNEEPPCRFRHRSGDSTSIRAASSARASSARTGCGTSKAASPTRRPTSMPTNGVVRLKPGDFVHDMSIRLTHRPYASLIVDVEAVTDKSPYQIVRRHRARLQEADRLAHRRLPPRGARAAGRRPRLHPHRRAAGAGGDHRVPDRVRRGRRANSPAPIARRPAPCRRRTLNDPPESRGANPSMLDTCHTWASDSEVTRRWVPDWTTGPDAEAVLPPPAAVRPRWKGDSVAVILEQREDLYGPVQILRPTASGRHTWWHPDGGALSARAHAGRHRAHASCAACRPGAAVPRGSGLRMQRRRSRPLKCVSPPSRQPA